MYRWDLSTRIMELPKGNINILGIKPKSAEIANFYPRFLYIKGLLL